MRIIELDSIDSKLFNISSTFSFLREESSLPPIAIMVEGSYFQISGFSSVGSSFIDYGSHSKDSALALFASFQRINFFYLVHLLNIANKLGVNFKNIKELEGVNNLSIYLEAMKLDRRILEYIALKNIPPKLIRLINSFSEVELEYLSSYLSSNEPSLQTFKKLVENIKDFDYLPPDFTFPKKESQSHRQVEAAYHTLLKQIRLHIEADKTFESASISIRIDNYEGFQKVLEALEKNQNAFEEYFKVLSSYDLC